MNFLNDSIKQLKTVLAEGLDSSVNFDSSASDGGSKVSESSREHDNLRKLCQHQSEEVNLTIVLIIALFFLCHQCVCTAWKIKTKGVFG